MAAMCGGPRRGATVAPPPRRSYTQGQVRQEAWLVRISDIWEQTREVLADRARALRPIGALAIFLPLAIQGAIKAYGGASPGAAALAAVVALASLPLLLWAVFTTVGMASDRTVNPRAADVAARRRVPAGLLAVLVAVAVALLAAVPILAAMAAGGYDFRAAAGGAGSTGPAELSIGARLFVSLYGLFLFGFALWAGARLFVLNPVIALEHRGIGAFARSVTLTRGLTAKLMGVNLLFLLVWGVAAFAARAVIFVIFRLLLGPGNIATATWLGGLADAAVTTAMVVIAAVFAARLHAAVAEPVSPSRIPTGPWG